MQTNSTASGYSRLLVKSKALLAVAMTIFVVSAQSQTLAMKYDTKNHPKAKGVWATIRYPSGWEVKEGERPNIVQKFSGDYNGMFVVLSLQIVDAGGAVEKECKDMGKKEFAETFSDESIKQFAGNVQKTSHENKPAFIYEVKHKAERAGMSLNFSHKVMTVCHKNTMISAWCSPSLFDKAKNTITSSLQQVNAAQPLCFQYFNSLVLMDSY